MIQVHDLIVREVILQLQSFVRSIVPTQLTEEQRGWLPSCRAGLDYLAENFPAGEVPRDCREAIAALIAMHMDRWQGLFLSDMRASGNWPETVSDRVTTSAYYATVLGAVLAEVALNGAENRVNLASQIVNTAMQAAQDAMRQRLSKVVNEAREMGPSAGRA